MTHYNFVTITRHAIEFLRQTNGHIPKTRHEVSQLLLKNESLKLEKERFKARFNEIASREDVMQTETNRLKLEKDTILKEKQQLATEVETIR